MTYHYLTGSKDEYRPMGADGKPLDVGNTVFSEPNINWGGYFHGKHPSQVAYWEKRTVSATGWKQV